MDMGESSLLFFWCASPHSVGVYSQFTESQYETVHSPGKTHPPCMMEFIGGIAWFSGWIKNEIRINQWRDVAAMAWCSWWWESCTIHFKKWIVNGDMLQPAMMSWWWEILFNSFLKWNASVGSHGNGGFMAMHCSISGIIEFKCWMQDFNSLRCISGVWQFKS